MKRPAEVPGEALLPRARAAIAERLGLGRRLPRSGLDPRLLAPGASFVTLTRDGQLRGCVGSLEAHRPLVDDVEANGCAAAFDDPRFPPLVAADLEGTRIEVSVLGALETLAASGEEELIASLVPGRDGLVLVAGGRRATFLPQVWRALAEPRDFVDRLRRKAGLGSDFWDLSPQFFRYRVDKWAEAEQRGSEARRG